MMRPTSRRQKGLTLVEFLVAMLILGFVMTLISEVVFQVSQVARAADAMTRGSLSRWNSGWSASELFANLLAPPEIGDDPPLAGRPQQVTGYTSRPLDGADTGISRFELELRPSDGTRRSTDLIARSAATQAGFAGDGKTVAVYPGRVEFAYLDGEDRLSPIWPTLTRVDDQDRVVLPRAVVVRDAASGAIVMWYGYGGEMLRPRQATDLFAAPAR